jgi:hypothetical protein
METDNVDCPIANRRKWQYFVKSLCYTCFPKTQKWTHGESRWYFAKALCSSFSSKTKNGHNMKITGGFWFYFQGQPVWLNNVGFLCRLIMHFAPCFASFLFCTPGLLLAPALMECSSVPDEVLVACKNKYDVIRRLFSDGKCRLCAKSCSATVNWESNADRHVQTYHLQFFEEQLSQWKRVSPFARAAEASRQKKKRRPSASPSQTEEARLNEVDFHKEILLWCTSSNDAYRVVENPHFRRICTLLPYQPHCANYYSRQMLPALGKELEATLKLALRETGSVALSTDGWTKRGRHFISVSAHFTSGGGLRTAMLGVRQVDAFEGLSALPNSQCVREIMTQFDIKDSQVSSVVSDTANVMPKMVRLLGLAWMPCAAHKLNLCVRSKADKRAPTGLLRIEPWRSTLQAVQSTVVQIKKSSILRARFLAAQDSEKHLELIMDVPTRWRSSYDTLQRALHLQPAITAIVASLPKPATIDWSLVKALVTCLSPMVKVTVYAEGEKYPTSGGFLPRLAAACKILKSQEGLTKTAADDLLASITKRFNLDAIVKADPAVLLTLLPSFLSPEWRGFEFLSQFGATPAQCLFAVESLKTFMVQLLGRLPVQAPVTTTQEIELVEDDLPLMRSVSSEGGAHAETLELAVYLSRNAPNIKDVGLISWWSLQEDLPRMRSIALKMLSIPASSASPERTWSRAKHVLTDLRSCMSPETFGLTMFLGCNDEWMKWLIR